MAFSLNLLSTKANQATGLAVQKRRQDDRLLLLLLGVAMSWKGPLLQQEGEDAGHGHGHEDEEDVHKLHAVFC